MFRKPKSIPPRGNTSQDSLELLYEISRELAAALELRTVLQRVLLLSMKSIGAISGSIIVLDDQGRPVESTIIAGGQVINNTTQQLRATLENGLAGWVIRNNQAALISDTSKDERWLHRPDDAPERSGPKSAVSAPLAVRDQLVGVMTLVHSRPGFFDQEHLLLIQAISDQSGITVLNARLYEESQRQARVMSALAESAASINATLKSDDVLQRILEQTSQALRAEVVSLALIDSPGEELVFRASIGPTSQQRIGLRLPLGQGVVGWVAREGQAVIVPDASKDARHYSDVDRMLGYSTEAIACAPILSRGRVIGVLEALNPTHGAFDPDALLFLMGIGSLAGSALRHAHLFERLQAAHQRYRELFEDSIDPIMITNWEGRILEANRQALQLTGLDVETLQSMYIDQLEIVDYSKLGEGYANLSDGLPIFYDTILYKQGRVEVPVQVFTRDTKIEGLSHIQWILRDITERINLDTLRNDLISMIYHDLRSPLANVISSLDIVETLLPEEADPALKSLLHVAIRSTERIQRLTNSLLDMRRLETGQPITNIQRLSPENLIQESIEAVAHTIEGKNQKIMVDIPPDLGQISVDADMIRRVLINLMENAVKYTPVERTISVGALREKDIVQMWVEDNGPGIPESEKERIFDKFTRLHTKDGPKGYGLGLAFCRLAVEKHGGRIWVENVPDSGAIFKFTLPVAVPEQETYAG